MVRGGSRGRPKKSLRDLSREHATDDEFKQIGELILETSSPITAAILGATVVEQELEGQLRKRLKRRDETLWGELTGESGPLNSFWKKIEMAFALGVIDEDVRAALNTIRHIRNAFAHAKKLLKFDHPLVVKELRCVGLPAKRTEFHKLLGEIRQDADPANKNGSPQRAYVALCFAVGNSILKREVRGMKARSRRLQRRIRQLTTSTSGLIFGFSPEQISKILAESGTDLGPMSPARQNADSNSATQKETQPSLALSPKSADDNKGK